MKIDRTTSCFVVAALALPAVVFGRTQGVGSELSTHSDVYSRMSELAARVGSARARGASSIEIERLLADYETLRARLGGDDPANANPSAAPQSGAPGSQFLVTPTCSGSSSTATFPGTTGPIANGSFVEWTANVSGLGAFLWDVDLLTTITHAACGDLDLTLKSPAGTVVTITTDNGALNDNCFNGTTWNDNVNDPATDHVYANLVTATPLSPEGRLAAFRGENPNGLWTLKVQDDALGNVGAMTAWSVKISALASAPSQTTTNFSRTPNLAITDNGTVFDTQLVSGVGSYLSKVVLYVEIPHTFASDLDLLLTSPAGTAVSVTTDNGGSFDNVFNGTHFDPDAPEPVTDHLYADLVVATQVSPEGSFDNFLGQNPNGTWKLTITDDTATNVGALVRWDLKVTTTINPNPPSPTVFSGGTGAIPDFGGAAPTLFTANVSNVSGLVWDIDLNTTIAHNANADIDATLRSPSGTTVTITTDNGFGTNVFNGTLFDDDANDPVSDHFYTSNTVATPLSPEGRLAAFRGENPNGIWTLAITDDSPAISGTLSAWSLALTSVPGLPTTASTVYSSSPNLPIPDNTTVVDTITASGLGTSIAGIVLYTEILHTWCEDVDVILTSPSGTAVAVNTDNAGMLDDVYNGTTWDPDVTDTPTDHVYVDLVVATPLSPEGSFDNFAGEDPNGVWTLSVSDDFNSDTGTFVRWDLTIKTCSISVPITYCPPVAPGTSHGCLPTISANANPDVAHSTPCFISVAGVEGQKAGLIFYGINGPVNLPWCSGANTFLCVKLPTQRTPPQNTGGVSSTCSGQLSLDWNAFQLANPASLGNPWSPGDHVYLQGWFRDPPSCKTTFLSEALDLTYQP